MAQTRRTPTAAGVTARPCAPEFRVGQKGAGDYIEYDGWSHHRLRQLAAERGLDPGDPEGIHQRTRLEGVLRAQDDSVDSYKDWGKWALWRELRIRRPDASLFLGAESPSADLIEALRALDRTQKFHGYARLPMELRIGIVESRFVNTERALYLPPLPLEELRVCRDVRGLVAKAFFGKNAFCLPLTAESEVRTDAATGERTEYSHGVRVMDETRRWLERVGRTDCLAYMRNFVVLIRVPNLERSIGSKRPFINHQISVSFRADMTGGQVRHLGHQAPGVRRFQLDPPNLASGYSIHPDVQEAMTRMCGGNKTCLKYDDIIVLLHSFDGWSHERGK